MGIKLVENVDDEVWHEFTSKCRAKKLKVGEELTRILKKEVEK